MDLELDQFGIDESLRILQEDRRDDSSLSPEKYREVVRTFEGSFGTLSPQQRELAKDGYWYACHRVYDTSPPPLSDMAHKMRIFGSLDNLDDTYRTTIGYFFEDALLNMEHLSRERPRVEIETSEKLADVNSENGIPIHAGRIAAFLLGVYPQIRNSALRKVVIETAVGVYGARSIARGLAENWEMDPEAAKPNEIWNLVLGKSRKDGEPSFDSGLRLIQQQTVMGTRPDYTQSRATYDYTNVIRPKDKEFLSGLTMDQQFFVDTST